jgi:hypothetical protein
MSYTINAGISISLDGTTWYRLTDHNREPIDISNNLIEHSQRMANGRMKKYVIANKKTLSTSWANLPSISSNTVDLNYSSAWLEAFYRANVFVPVYVKLVHAKDTVPSIGSIPNDSTYQSSRLASETIQCYITKFDLKIRKRMASYDYVEMNIEFTEI